MRHVKIFTIFALTPFAAYGAIEPGTYLFLYGQLVGCGDRTYVLDYAQVPENGQVEFFEEIEMRVLGLSEVEIGSRLAKKIGAKTGHTPKTLSVRVVPATDSKRIATELMKLVSSRPACRRSTDPYSPPPDLSYIRSLANAPSNKSLHRPLMAPSGR